ncbi:MAG: integrase core domain-containing protein, partial [Gammaproteobacteria bacterium]|nr:integrase core domain-containing protein [Gammaproteobacteria bacterium]
EAEEIVFQNKIIQQRPEDSHDVLAHMEVSSDMAEMQKLPKLVTHIARSPNLNAFSERWVKSAKEECLSKLILFGESSLRHTLREYLAHYNAKRNHQAIQFAW